LGDWNDVTVASIENKLGIHASPTAVLNLGENDNCLGWIIGEEGQGISSMFLMMNGARIYTGLIGLALGGAAYENARAYKRIVMRLLPMKPIRVRQVARLRNCERS
ncbi:MAG: hypothetical protein DSY30_03445, partial [Alphaproteobacteria bacterium]